MTPETTEQAEARRKAAVMLAFADGKTIQVKMLESDWETTGSPRWDWYRCDYRIKPEPREWWINVYSAGAIFPYTPHTTKELADMNASGTRIECVHVKEVL